MLKKRIFKKHVLPVFMALVMTIGILPVSNAMPYNTLLETQGDEAETPALIPVEVPIFEDSSGEYSFAERAADAVARLSLAQKSVLMLADASSAISADQINNADNNSGLDKSKVPKATKGLASWRFWNEASHGFSGTFSYPTAVAVGATWDKEAFRMTTSHMGEIVREAAIRRGNPSVGIAYFSPTINLGRDPRWGRNDEIYSEDPYQTAVMANFFTSAIEGVDPDTGEVLDPAGYRNGLATLKHYTANNHECLGNSPMRLPPSRIHDGANTSLKALRDYFVKPYSTIIKKGSVSAVMTAYSHVRIGPIGTRYDAYNDNDYIDGTAESSSASSYLMSNLLRQTYGLKGHVVSDCDSYKSAGYLLYTGTPPERAGGVLRAPTAGESFAWSLMYGGYLECSGGVGGGFYPHRYDRVETQSAMMGVQTDKGTLTEHAFDLAAHNILTERITMGELDTVRIDNTAATGFKILDDASSRVAEQNGAAGGGNSNNNGATPERIEALHNLQKAAVVLLKNEEGVARTDKYDFSGRNILPLRDLTGKLKIAIVGTAQTDSFGGGYNMGGRLGLSFISHQQNIRESITAANPDAEIEWNFVLASGNSNTPGETDLNTIRDADLVIVMVNTNGDSAEDRDRQSIALRNGKEKLVERCAAQNENLILLIEAGGPVELDKFIDKTKAVMWCGTLGSTMKVAFGPNLTGEHNPSGRTNQIWYRYVCNADNYGHANDSHWPTVNDPVAIEKTQQPRIDHYNLYPMDNTLEGSTGTNSGRTYMYNPNNYLDPSDENAPTFPFGYGLSYTTFEYDNLTITSSNGDSITPDDTITVSFDITNTGDFDGHEISQLYVSHPGASADRNNPNTKNGLPIQVLRGFEKTFVEKGKTVRVTMELKIADLALFDETTKKLEVPEGQYTLKIGSTSTDIRLSEPFNVTGSWTPVPEIVTLKIHQEGDMDAPSMNDGTIIEERLFFQGGREIMPKVCVSLNNEELVGYITYESLSFIDRLPQSRPYPDGMTVVLSSNRPEVAEVVDTPEGQKVFAKGIGPATITATVTYNGVTVTGEQVVYVVSEPSVDLQLHDLKIDGVTIPGFSRTRNIYSYPFDESADIEDLPEVEAYGNTLEGMQPKITVIPPSALPGTYIIRLEDPDDPAVYRNVYLGVGWNLLPSDSADFKTGATSVAGKKWIKENINSNAAWVDEGLRIITESAASGPQNLFMLSGLGDWGVTTSTSLSSTLTADGQQYGLAVIQDQDNYIRFTTERNNTNVIRVVQAVNGGETVITSMDIDSVIPGVTDPDPAQLHFRIDSEGGDYTFSVSGNGTEWTVVGTMTKPNYACPKIAPWANNGGNADAPGLGVTFSNLIVSDVNVTNPKLSGITINGVPLDGFNSVERNYNIFLDLTGSNARYSITNGVVPNIVATPETEGTEVKVTLPASLPGNVTITLTSPLATRIYSLRFVYYPESDHMVGGAMDRYWDILNQDNTTLELVNGRGIKLMSQPFSLHDAGMKNILVRPGAAFSYVAAAKVYLPVTPNEEAQQIAFGVYENANNYLKLSIEYKNGARRVRFAKYENGVAIQEHWTNLDDAAIPQIYEPNRDENLTVWLRFEKTSDMYKAAVSFGGDILDEVNGWVTVGSCTVPTGGSGTDGAIIAEYQNPQIFVAALNESNAASIEAYVESVMLNKIEGLTEDYDNLEDGFNAVLAYAVPDAADVVAELPATASFRQKSEVYDGLKISDFAADLPNVPYGYEWMVKGEPAGMFDIAPDGTVTAKSSGIGTLSLILKAADFMGGHEKVFHTVDVTVLPVNTYWKQVTDFNEIQDGARILIVSPTTNGALTNKVTPESIPATSISNVPIRGFVSTPVTTDKNDIIISPVTNDMIWTVEDRGTEVCTGGSNNNPSYGNRHFRFSNAYPDASTDEAGPLGKVAMAGDMYLTRVGPENAGAGTTMVMRPATNHSVTNEARLDWCFHDHGDGLCSLTNYIHGGTSSGTDYMFALAGLKPTDPDAQDGFALSGTNQTRDSAVTAIRQRALLKFYKEVEASLAGEVSIGDGSDIVEIGKLLTADVSALAIDPDLFGDNFGTLSYQWYRDEEAIAGANSETYIVQQADEGKLITVRVTSSTCAGSVISNAVTAIKASVEEKVVLTGTDYVEPASDFIVGISLNNATDVFAEDITLTYDADVFEYVSAVSANSNIMIVEEDSTVAGKVRLIAVNIGGVSGESSELMNLTFKAKAGVQNTTVSIAVTKANLGTAPEGTVIEAELSSKTITIGVVTEVDKDQLIAAINSAEALYASAEVGSQPGQYPQSAKNAFRAAIDAAIAVRDNTSATQEEVDTALEAILDAIDVFKDAEIPAEEVDKAALAAAISVAENLFEEAVVGTEVGQYPQEAKDAFGAAIAAAKTVYNDSNATQNQVDDAVTALNMAIDTFKAAEIKEASADINNDGVINVGDLAIVAYYYGKDSTSADWAAAKIADMNGDNKIDILDLAYVALKIWD